MGILSLGWGTPLGGPGPDAWDWWVPAGFLAVFLIFVTARRRPPLLLASLLALLISFVVADLTHLWGVAPVWGPLLAVALTRHYRGALGRPRV